MTEAEAIKILKKPTEHIKAEEDECVFTSDFVKAYEVAIKALEKHISVSREIRHGDYFCPECGSNVEYQGYCHACGQRVY